MISVITFKNNRVHYKLTGGIDEQFLNIIRELPTDDEESYFQIISIVEQIITTQNSDMTAISYSGFIVGKLDELSRNNSIPNDRDRVLLNRYRNWAVMPEQVSIIEAVLKRRPFAIN